MIGKCRDFLLKETTTIGLRWRVDDRIKTKRTIKQIETRYGLIKCKVAEVGAKVINISPEYEDCKRLALENNVPVLEVINEARVLLSGTITE
jgi:uncharacterized protein (DUF111 family)